MRKYYANVNMLLRKFSYCLPDVKMPYVQILLLHNVLFFDVALTIPLHL